MITERDQGSRKKETKGIKRAWSKKKYRVNAKKYKYHTHNSAACVISIHGTQSSSVLLLLKNKKARLGESETETTVHSSLFRQYFFIQKRSYIRTQELDYKQLSEIRGDISCTVFSLSSVVRAYQSN